MPSATRRALEDFDNAHDFERLCADVLNQLGYEDVDPSAPGGGGDGGMDIKYRDGDESGVAFVSLDRKVSAKFEADLGKLSEPVSQIAFFSNRPVSPAAKLAMSQLALLKNSRLIVFDVERLRSLLDGRFKELRRKYLRIEDPESERLRSEVRRLLRYPKADPKPPPAPTEIERLVRDHLPLRLFNLILQFDESAAAEAADIGPDLVAHLETYHKFRERASFVEERMFKRIGTLLPGYISPAWEITLSYTWMRFGGCSRDEIAGGGFGLNYSLTYERLDSIFTALDEDLELRDSIMSLLRDQAALENSVQQLSGRIKAT